MSINAINKRIYHKYNVALYVVIYVGIAMRLSNYALWALSIVVIVLSSIKHRGKLKHTRMPGKTFVYGMILIGTATGLIRMLNDEYNSWHFFRDLLRSSAFIVFWLSLGIVVSIYENANRETFYKTLFFLCGFVSVIDVLLSIPTRIANIQYGFAGFTGSYSTDKYMLAVGFALSLLKPLEKRQTYFGTWTDTIFKGAIIINFTLSFSRNAIIVFAFLMMPFMRKYWGLAIKVVIIAVMAIYLMQQFLPEVSSQFYEKIIRSISEISSNHSWLSQTEISRNWRGYEIFCEQRDFASQNAVGQLFGKGFGSSIDVGAYAFLVTSESSLPYLHNGYYTMLMKAGLIGVFFNVMFYLYNFRLVLSNGLPSFDRRFLQGVILSMVVSTWVVGGVMISYEIPIFTMVILWLNKINKRI